MGPCGIDDIDLIQGVFAASFARIDPPDRRVMLTSMVAGAVLCVTAYWTWRVVEFVSVMPRGFGNALYCGLVTTPAAALIGLLLAACGRMMVWTVERFSGRGRAAQRAESRRLPNACNAPPIRWTSKLVNPRAHHDSDPSRVDDGVCGVGRRERDDADREPRRHGEIGRAQPQDRAIIWASVASAMFGCSAGETPKNS